MKIDRSNYITTCIDISVNTYATNYLHRFSFGKKARYLISITPVSAFDVGDKFLFVPFLYFVIVIKSNRKVCYLFAATGFKNGRIFCDSAK